ncbi:MAG: hypothetical protein II217_05440 [Alistipes sp.]|nr:hypothetical protein [Alistipes sp.]
MNVKEYITNEAFTHYGALPIVVERLLHFGCRPLLKWATHSEIWRKVKQEGTHIVWKREYLRIAQSIDEEFVTGKYLETNVSQSRVLQLASIQKKREYEFIRKELEDHYPCPLFWDSVLPYAWLSCKKLVTLHLLGYGWHVFDIAATTGLSERTIYLLKKWLYDTKSNAKAVSQV